MLMLSFVRTHSSSVLSFSVLSCLLSPGWGLGLWTTSKTRRQSMELALECLKNFTGDTLIHVGELIQDGCLSATEAPWGRTSTDSFQQKLMARFHCLLRVSLPAWPLSRDSLTVWKRSQTAPIFVEMDEEEEGQGEEGEGSEEMEVEGDGSSKSGLGSGKSKAAGGGAEAQQGKGEEEEEREAGGEEQTLEVMWYRNIPAAERLPVDSAAPCVAHLLRPPYPPLALTSSASSSSSSSSSSNARTNSSNDNTGISNDHETQASASAAVAAAVPMTSTPPTASVPVVPAPTAPLPPPNPQVTRSI